MKSCLKRAARRFGLCVPSSFRYWEGRAKQYERRAVLNIGHPEEEYEAVTAIQKQEIYPSFKQLLSGSERLVLDFGCGPGRFAADLASMIKGKAIGIDPIRKFLEIAPKNADVEYRLMKDTRIPVASSSVDVVWVCLVLGGLRGKTLKMAVDEIERVLKGGPSYFSSRILQKSRARTNGSLGNSLNTGICSPLHNSNIFATTMIWVSVFPLSLAGK
jgi:SAM-dependent methyltransferase